MTSRNNFYTMNVAYSRNSINGFKFATYFCEGNFFFYKTWANSFAFR